MPDQIPSLPPQSPQVILGALLRAQRLAKKSEITELARTLILSAAQLTAIESGSQVSFHNQNFYLRALKKYMVHMDLAMDPQVSQLFTEIETKLLSTNTKTHPKEVHLLIHAGLADRRSSRLPQLPVKKSHLLGALLTVMIITVLGVMLIKNGSEKVPAKHAETAINTNPTSKTKNSADQLTGSTVQKNKQEATSPTSEAAQQLDLAKNIETKQEPIQNAATNTPPERPMLKLTFSGSSWVQATEQNGKSTEKVFTPKDSLELEPSTLSSLVIGNARETQLFFNGDEINLSRHLNPGSGVARFNQAEILKITQ